MGRDHGAQGETGYLGGIHVLIPSNERVQARPVLDELVLSAEDPEGIAPALQVYSTLHSVCATFSVEVAKRIVAMGRALFVARAGGLGGSDGAEAKCHEKV